METMILVWILVWKYGFLWISLDFVWEKKNQTINSFLMNLGLKESYLVYWLIFGLGLVDCNP